MINVVEKILKEKEKKLTVYPVKSNQASQLGHPCLRYLVHNRLDWDKKEKPTLRLQLIFDEGGNQEQLVIRDMIEAGIKIEELQKYFEWKEYQITGKIDGFIRNEKHLIPFEIKSMHPFTFNSIKTIEDFQKKEYLKRYIAQLNLYLLMSNKEFGIFILKNKSTGELKQIELELDYELGEELLQKAEKINKYVEEKKYPEPIEYNEELCGFCVFKKLCPVTKPKSESEIIEDIELQQNLERWYELKNLVKEYNELDKRIKSKLKEKTNIKVGNFYIEGKWIESTKYKIPEDIKKEYAEKYKYWKIVKIVKI